MTTHIILDIIFYTIAILWTVGFLIVFSYNKYEPILTKRYNESRFLKQLKTAKNKRQDKQKEVIKHNLRQVEIASRKKTDKEFNVRGYKIYAASYKDAVTLFNYTASLKKRM